MRFLNRNPLCLSPRDQMAPIRSRALRYNAVPQGITLLSVMLLPALPHIGRAVVLTLCVVCGVVRRRRGAPNRRSLTLCSQRCLCWAVGSPRDAGLRAAVFRHAPTAFGRARLWYHPSTVFPHGQRLPQPHHPREYLCKVRASPPARPWPGRRRLRLTSCHRRVIACAVAAAAIVAAVTDSQLLVAEVKSASGRRIYRSLISAYTLSSTIPRPAQHCAALRRATGMFALPSRTPPPPQRAPPPRGARTA